MGMSDQNHERQWHKPDKHKQHSWWFWFWP